MNRVRFSNIINKYCRDFEKNWEDEEYKWREIKQFQEHYSVNKELFIDNLRQSLNLSSNLIASQHYYPAKEIIDLAEIFPDEVRIAINSLLYGENDILSGIEQYKNDIKELKRKNNSISKSDGCDLRFISTLLFYAHPEEYIIYKFKEITEFARNFETGISVKKGNSKGILQSQTLADLVIDYLETEKETNPSVKEILKKYADKMKHPEYYKDKTYRVLAQNIIWYATAYQVGAKEPVFEQTSEMFFEHGKLTQSTYCPKLRVEKAKGKSIDYIKIAEEKARVGTWGEEAVLRFENQRLSKLGFRIQAQWKSKNDGDGFGYDILSYDENSNPIYIEVKATKGPKNTPFYITAVELAASEKYGDQYYLYHVYVENGKQEIEYYCGPEIRQLCNSPILYMVTNEKKP